MVRCWLAWTRRDSKWWNGFQFEISFSRSSLGYYLIDIDSRQIESGILIIFGSSTTNESFNPLHPKIFSLKYAGARIFGTNYRCECRVYRVNVWAKIRRGR